jgi:hypothetical protein
MRVFLDDIRMPSMSHREGKGLGENYSDLENWVIVRDYFEFIHIIDGYIDQIELISFDHDLACYDGDTEYTGKSAADYLINKCIESGRKFPDWYIHSDNTSGKANIIGLILSYLKNVEEVDTSNFRYFHNGMIGGKPV